VMFDAALYYKEGACKPPWFDALNLARNEFVLCTIHRAENTDDRERMRGIFAGLERARLPVILPLHPRTRKKLLQINLPLPANITVVDPVGYLEMVWLESSCKLIATDSGGVQKEAYFHQKPCVTLRDETEWAELVSKGVNKIVGADPGKIANALGENASLDFGKCLYGNGRSSVRIVKQLSFLN